MKGLVKFIGTDKAKKIIIKILNAIIMIMEDFQKEVEQMKGTHSPYYSKSKKECEDYRAAINLICPNK